MPASRGALALSHRGEWFFNPGAYHSGAVAFRLLPLVPLTDNSNGTATLVGTPTVSGTFTLTLTASNEVLPNAVQTFTLIVKPAPSQRHR